MADQLRRYRVGDVIQYDDNIWLIEKINESDRGIVTADTRVDIGRYTDSEIIPHEGVSLSGQQFLDSAELVRDWQDNTIDKITELTKQGFVFYSNGNPTPTRSSLYFNLPEINGSHFFIVEERIGNARQAQEIAEQIIHNEYAGDVSEIIADGNTFRVADEQGWDLVYEVGSVYERDYDISFYGVINGVHKNKRIHFPLSKDDIEQISLDGYNSPESNSAISDFYVDTNSLSFDLVGLHSPLRSGQTNYRDLNSVAQMMCDLTYEQKAFIGAIADHMRATTPREICNIIDQSVVRSAGGEIELIDDISGIIPQLKTMDEMSEIAETHWTEFSAMRDEDIRETSEAGVSIMDERNIEVIENLIDEIRDLAQEHVSENGIDVWVGNIGKYNEGELVGRWITLPQPASRLAQILADDVAIGHDTDTGQVYDEYAIYTYSDSGLVDKLGLSISETCSLDDLNILAGIASGLNDSELAAVKAVGQDRGINNDILAMANIVIQSDDIAWHDYNSDTNSIYNNEERLARTEVDDNVLGMLDRDTLEQYFDYEAYGRSMRTSGEIKVGDYGFTYSELNLPALDEFDDSIIEDAAPEYLSEIDSYHGDETIDDAVVLAQRYFNLSDAQVDAVKLAARQTFDTDTDVGRAIANLAIQADVIVYTELPNNTDNVDKQIGEILADENKVLDDGDMLEYYFNYAEYGRELGKDYLVFDEGYLERGVEIATDVYREDELIRFAEDSLGDVGYYNLSAENVREQAMALNESNRGYRNITDIRGALEHVGYESWEIDEIVDEIKTNQSSLLQQNDTARRELELHEVIAPGNVRLSVDVDNIDSQIQTEYEKDDYSNEQIYNLTDERNSLVGNYIYEQVSNGQVFYNRISNEIAQGVFDDEGNLEGIAIYRLSEVPSVDELSDYSRKDSISDLGFTSVPANADFSSLDEKEREKLINEETMRIASEVGWGNDSVDRVVWAAEDMRTSQQKDTYLRGDGILDTVSDLLKPVTHTQQFRFDNQQVSVEVLNLYTGSSTEDFKFELGLYDQDHNLVNTISGLSSISLEPFELAVDADQKAWLIDNNLAVDIQRDYTSLDNGYSLVLIDPERIRELDASGFRNYVRSHNYDNEVIADIHNNYERLITENNVNNDIPSEVVEGEDVAALTPYRGEEVEVLCSAQDMTSGLQLIIREVHNPIHSDETNFANAELEPFEVSVAGLERNAELVGWLSDNNIAHTTDRTVQDRNYRYPILEVNPERLRELDPAGYEAYIIERNAKDPLSEVQVDNKVLTDSVGHEVSQVRIEDVAGSNRGGYTINLPMRTDELNEFIRDHFYNQIHVPDVRVIGVSAHSPLGRIELNDALKYQWEMSGFTKIGYPVYDINLLAGSIDGMDLSERFEVLRRVDDSEFDPIDVAYIAAEITNTNNGEKVFGLKTGEDTYGIGDLEDAIALHLGDRGFFYFDSFRIPASYIVGVDDVSILDNNSVPFDSAPQFNQAWELQFGEGDMVVHDGKILDLTGKSAWIDVKSIRDINEDGIAEVKPSGDLYIWSNRDEVHASIVEVPTRDIEVFAREWTADARREYRGEYHIDQRIKSELVDSFDWNVLPDFDSEAEDRLIQGSDEYKARWQEYYSAIDELISDLHEGNTDTWKTNLEVVGQTSPDTREYLSDRLGGLVRSLNAVDRLEQGFSFYNDNFGDRIWQQGGYLFSGGIIDANSRYNGFDKDMSRENLNNITYITDAINIYNDDNKNKYLDLLTNIGNNTEWALIGIGYDDDPDHTPILASEIRNPQTEEKTEQEQNVYEVGFAVEYDSNNWIIEEIITDPETDNPLSVRLGRADVNNKNEHIENIVDFDEFIEGAALLSNGRDIARESIDDIFSSDQVFYRRAYRNEIIMPAPFNSEQMIVVKSDDLLNGKNSAEVAEAIRHGEYNSENIAYVDKDTAYERLLGEVGWTCDGDFGLEVVFGSREISLNFPLNVTTHEEFVDVFKEATGGLDPNSATFDLVTHGSWEILGIRNNGNAEELNALAMAAAPLTYEQRALLANAAEIERGANDPIRMTNFLMYGTEIRIDSVWLVDARDYRQIPLDILGDDIDDLNRLTNNHMHHVFTDNGTLRPTYESNIPRAGIDYSLNELLEEIDNWNEEYGLTSSTYNTAQEAIYALQAGNVNQWNDALGYVQENYFTLGAQLYMATRDYAESLVSVDEPIGDQRDAALERINEERDRTRSEEAETDKTEDTEQMSMFDEDITPAAEIGAQTPKDEVVTNEAKTDTTFDEHVYFDRNIGLYVYNIKGIDKNGEEFNYSVDYYQKDGELDRHSISKDNLSHQDFLDDGFRDITTRTTAQRIIEGEHAQREWLGSYAIDLGVGTTTGLFYGELAPSGINSRGMSNVLFAFVSEDARDSWVDKVNHDLAEALEYSAEHGGGEAPDFAIALSEEEAREIYGNAGVERARALTLANAEGASANDLDIATYLQNEYTSSDLATYEKYGQGDTELLNTAKDIDLAQEIFRVGRAVEYGNKNWIIEDITNDPLTNAPQQILLGRVGAGGFGTHESLSLAFFEEFAQGANPGIDSDFWAQESIKDVFSTDRVFYRNLDKREIIMPYDSEYMRIINTHEGDLYPEKCGEIIRAINEGEYENNDIEIVDNDVAYQRILNEVGWKTEAEFGINYSNSETGETAILSLPIDIGTRAEFVNALVEQLGREYDKNGKFSFNEGGTWDVFLSTDNINPYAFTIGGDAIDIDDFNTLAMAAAPLTYKQRSALGVIADIEYGATNVADVTNVMLQGADRIDGSMKSLDNVLSDVKPEKYSVDEVRAVAHDRMHRVFSTEGTWIVALDEIEKSENNVSQNARGANLDIAQSQKVQVEVGSRRGVGKPFRVDVPSRVVDLEQTIGKDLEHREDVRVLSIPQNSKLAKVGLSEVLEHSEERNLRVDDVNLIAASLTLLSDEQIASLGEFVEEENFDIEPVAIAAYAYDLYADNTIEITKRYEDGAEELNRSILGAQISRDIGIQDYFNRVGFDVPKSAITGKNDIEIGLSDCVAYTEGEFKYYKLTFPKNASVEYDGDKYKLGGMIAWVSPDEITVLDDGTCGIEPFGILQIDKDDATGEDKPIDIPASAWAETFSLGEDFSYGMDEASEDARELLKSSDINGNEITTELRIVTDEVSGRLFLDVYDHEGSIDGDVVNSRRFASSPVALEPFTAAVVLYEPLDDIYLYDSDEGDLFADENNLGERIGFIDDHGRYSSLYQFDPARLKQLDPVGYQRYLDINNLDDPTQNDNVNENTYTPKLSDRDVYGRVRNIDIHAEPVDVYDSDATNPYGLYTYNLNIGNNRISVDLHDTPYWHHSDASALSEYFDRLSYYQNAVDIMRSRGSEDRGAYGIPDSFNKHVEFLQHGHIEPHEYKDIAYAFNHSNEIREWYNDRKNDESAPSLAEFGEHIDDIYEDALETRRVDNDEEDGLIHQDTNTDTEIDTSAFDKLRARYPELAGQRQEVVEGIVRAMQSGDFAKWEREWSAGSAPFNPVTGKQYNGSNKVNLSLIAAIRGYGDPRWMTAKNAKNQGWSIKDDEVRNNSYVEHWSSVPVYEKDENGSVVFDEEGKKKVDHYFLRIDGSYAVYNASQIDGIEAWEPPFDENNDNELSIIADRLIESIQNEDALNCEVKEQDQSTSPGYQMDTNKIYIPHRSQFTSNEAFISALLHEAAHATGHKDALGRLSDANKQSGSEEYAREELVAELSAVFLCGELGLTHEIEEGSEFFESHVAYLSSWASAIAKDPKVLYDAIGDANRATNMIIGNYDKTLEKYGESRKLTSELKATRAAVAQKQVSDIAPIEIDKKYLGGQKYDANTNKWVVCRADDSECQPYPGVNNKSDYWRVFVPGGSRVLNDYGREITLGDRDNAAVSVDNVEIDGEHAYIIPPKHMNFRSYGKRSKSKYVSGEQFVQLQRTIQNNTAQEEKEVQRAQRERINNEYFAAASQLYGYDKMGYLDFEKLGSDLIGNKQVIVGNVGIVIREPQENDEWLPQLDRYKNFTPSNDRNSVNFELADNTFDAVVAQDPDMLVNSWRQNPQDWAVYLNTIRVGAAGAFNLNTEQKAALNTTLSIFDNDHLSAQVIGNIAAQIDQIKYASLPIGDSLSKNQQVGFAYARWVVQHDSADDRENLFNRYLNQNLYAEHTRAVDEARQQRSQAFINELSARQAAEKNAESGNINYESNTGINTSTLTVGKNTSAENLGVTNESSLDNPDKDEVSAADDIESVGGSVEASTEVIENDVNSSTNGDNEDINNSKVNEGVQVDTESLANTNNTLDGSASVAQNNTSEVRYVQHLSNGLVENLDYNEIDGAIDDAEEKFMDDPAIAEVFDRGEFDTNFNILRRVNEAIVTGGAFDIDEAYNSLITIENELPESFVDVIYGLHNGKTDDEILETIAEHTRAVSQGDKDYSFIRTQMYNNECAYNLDTGDIFYRVTQEIRTDDRDGFVHQYWHTKIDLDTAHGLVNKEGSIDDYSIEDIAVHARTFDNGVGYERLGEWADEHLSIVSNDGWDSPGEFLDVNEFRNLTRELTANDSNADSWTRGSSEAINKEWARAHGIDQTSEDTPTQLIAQESYEEVLARQEGNVQDIDEVISMGAQEEIRTNDIDTPLSRNGAQDERNINIEDISIDREPLGVGNLDGGRADEPSVVASGLSSESEVALGSGLDGGGADDVAVAATDEDMGERIEEGVRAQGILDADSVRAEDEQVGERGARAQTSQAQEGVRAQDFSAPATAPVTDAQGDIGVQQAQEGIGVEEGVNSEGMQVQAQEEISAQEGNLQEGAQVQAQEGIGIEEGMQEDIKVQYAQEGIGVEEEDVQEGVGAEEGMQEEVEEGVNMQEDEIVEKLSGIRVELAEVRNTKNLSGADEQSFVYNINAGGATLEFDQIKDSGVSASGVVGELFNEASLGSEVVPGADGYREFIVEYMGISDDDIAYVRDRLANNNSDLAGKINKQNNSVNIVSVYNLQIDESIANILIKNSIFSISDVLDKSKEELLEIKGLGNVSVDRIAKAISNSGYGKLKEGTLADEKENIENNNIALTLSAAFVVPGVFSNNINFDTVLNQINEAETQLVNSVNATDIINDPNNEFNILRGAVRSMRGNEAVDIGAAKHVIDNANYELEDNFVNAINKSWDVSGNIIVLDSETTGFTAGEDDLLTLTIYNGRGEELFDEKFRPTRKDSWKGAQKVNGITPESVKNEKTIAEYKDEIEKIFNNADGYILYNAQFDLSMLDGSGIDIPNKPVFDVMVDFADVYTENNKWVNLTKCSNYFDYTFDPHKAKNDVEATLHCATMMLSDKQYRDFLYAHEKTPIDDACAIYASSDKEWDKLINIDNKYMCVGVGDAVKMVENENLATYNAEAKVVVVPQKDQYLHSLGYAFMYDLSHTNSQDLTYDNLAQYVTLEEEIKAIEINEGNNDIDKCKIEFSQLEEVLRDKAEYGWGYAGADRMALWEDNWNRANNNIDINNIESNINCLYTVYKDRGKYGFKPYSEGMSAAPLPCDISGTSVKLDKDNVGFVLALHNGTGETYTVFAPDESVRITGDKVIFSPNMTDVPKALILPNAPLELMHVGDHKAEFKKLDIENLRECLVNQVAIRGMIDKQHYEKGKTYSIERRDRDRDSAPPKDWGVEESRSRFAAQALSKNQAAPRIPQEVSAVRGA